MVVVVSTVVVAPTEGGSVGWERGIAVFVVGVAVGVCKTSTLCCSVEDSV
jgi:hypothetical protein